MAAIAAEHSKATDELTALIELQGRATPAAAPHYQARIDLLAEQIAALDQRKRVLIGAQQAEVESRKHEAAAIAALTDILPRLWTLPEPEINQHLHWVLRSWRIAIDHGQIMSFVRLA